MGEEQGILWLGREWRFEEAQESVGGNRDRSGEWSECLVIREGSYYFTEVVDLLFPLQKLGRVRS